MDRASARDPHTSRSSVGLAIIIATAFILQIATATRYGYFRDELYYLDCARHLAWGYVDQPPLIAFITWIELHLAGTSLYSLRFLPAVAGALTVWMAGRFASYVRRRSHGAMARRFIRVGLKRIFDDV